MNNRALLEYAFCVLRREQFSNDSWLTLGHVWENQFWISMTTLLTILVPLRVAVHTIQASSCTQAEAVDCWLTQRGLVEAAMSSEPAAMKKKVVEVLNSRGERFYGVVPLASYMLHPKTGLTCMMSCIFLFFL